MIPGVESTRSAIATPPSQIDGFPAHAPELAEVHDGFASDAHDALDPLEDAHFWFRCRRDLLVHLLRRHAPDARSFCEVGCGNGSVLATVARALPGMTLCGVEASIAGLRHARRRVPHARLLQGDATRLPFVEEFDAVGTFDVLEHLDDDLAALRSIHRALRPGGVLLATVPQHRWLWSAADTAACHRRRYTRAILAERLTAAGFTVCRQTSYLVWLLPAMIAARRGPSGGEGQMTRLPAVVDRALELITRGETALTRLGADHRWGGSLVVVARR
jgi:SAM-dependent methyltransferase